MKAFICLALVACVAARSVDLDTMSNLRLWKEKSLLKDDLLFKNRFQLPTKSLDTLETLKNLKVNSWDEHRVSVLSFEEIVQTSLFREYYEIPLFRQYLTQYPVVFRRYIESPLFQQFWTVPQFQQYFRNPIFFYKYIVPQVQIIAQTQQETGVFGHFAQEESRDSRDVVVGQYLNRILNSLRYGQQYNTLPYSTRYNTNTLYNGEYTRDLYNYQPVNYKFLLDKIYKTLFVNKPVVGEVTEVKTDVKVAPAHEKVVEPITGETKVVVQEPKIVDVKVDEKVIPRTQVVAELEHEVIVKETLLKKLLLTKKISYEVYTVLKTLPLGELKKVVRQIVGDYEYITLIKDIETPYVTRRDFITRDIETTPFLERDLVDTPFYNRETPLWTRDVLETPFNKYSTYGDNLKYNQLIKEFYNNEIPSEHRVNPLVRELFNQYNLRDEIIRA